MSLILGKRVPFFRKCQQFRKKGYFLSHFTGKGVFSGASSQRFLKKGVIFPSVNISDLKNDHTSPLLHVSGQTGMYPQMGDWSLITTKREGGGGG